MQKLFLLFFFSVFLLSGLSADSRLEGMWGNRDTDTLIDFGFNTSSQGVFIRADWAAQEVMEEEAFSVSGNTIRIHRREVAVPTVRRFFSTGDWSRNGVHPDFQRLFVDWRPHSIWVDRMDLATFIGRRPPELFSNYSALQMIALSATFFDSLFILEKPFSFIDNDTVIINGDRFRRVDTLTGE